MKNFYDYMIARYGNQSESPNLHQMIQELEGRINVLEEKYNGALMDIKRLEEENIETANVLYEVIHSISAVDARIDIVMESKQ
jgi:uncharacterized protein YfkK (UPF0435 family)